MKVTVPTYESVPEGVYPAVFIGVSDREGDRGTYWAWEFHVRTADGVEPVIGFSSINFGRKSKAYKWASSLLGRRPEDGETVDLDALTGQACSVEIGINPDNGFNRIENVTAPRETGPLQHLPDSQPF